MEGDIMIGEWYEIEGVAIVPHKKKSTQQVVEEAATLACRTWRRKHEEEPEAVFMRDPFADEWDGLPVIVAPDVPAGFVYVGVTKP